MHLDRELSYRLPMLTGDDIRQIQQALIRAGALRNSGADGVFGPGTRDAVRAFQQQMRAGNPAIEVDGIVGRDTWSALFPDDATAVTAPGLTVPAPITAGNTTWRTTLQPYADRLTPVHGAPLGSGARRWCLLANGVAVDGPNPRGSGGPPTTAGKVWADFRDALEKNAAAYGVPLELLVATICTESHGNPNACRLEPGYVSDEATPNKVSPGLMQCLISTAREATHQPTLTRAEMFDPEVAIRAGAAYLKQQAIRPGGTNFDPPLVGIAYNAGSLRPADNPWGLVQTARPPEFHADVFTEFFNDCCAVLAALPADQRPHPQTPSFWVLLNVPAV